MIKQIKDRVGRILCWMAFHKLDTGRKITEIEGGNFEGPRFIVEHNCIRSHCGQTICKVKEI